MNAPTLPVLLKNEVSKGWCSVPAFIESVHCKFIEADTELHPAPNRN